MKILVDRPISSTSTNSAFWRKFKDGNFMFLSRLFIMNNRVFSWQIKKIFNLKAGQGERM